MSLDRKLRFGDHLGKVFITQNQPIQECSKMKYVRVADSQFGQNDSNNSFFFYSGARVLPLKGLEMTSGHV